MKRSMCTGAALAAVALSVAALATAVAGPADAAAPPACTGSQLVMGYRGPNGGLGAGGIVLEFRNRGAHTCRLHGYPDFDAVDSHGRVLERAERTYLGSNGGSHDRTVPTVNLRPGHYASAIAEWGTNNGHGGACSSAAGFDFTPAGTSRTMHRDFRYVELCRLEVHPTTYGQAGEHD